MIMGYRMIFKFLKRKASVLMIAFMLGMSNVMLGETRMVNDTGVQTEQQEVFSDDELLH
jgi:hypothetical protein